MTRDFERIELGIHVTSENGWAGTHYLFGSGAPGSNAQENNAEAGSLYNETGGGAYIKHTAGSGTDKWTKIQTAQDAVANIWYPAAVKAATADAAPSEGGTIDLTNSPHSDDDAPELDGTDFVLGDYVLFDCDGTPTMARVTNINLTGGGGSDHILTYTLDAAHATYPVEPIADGEMISVKYNLPDGPDAQEKQAILHYSEGVCKKVGDFNWDLADSISLTAGWTATNGTVAASDTVEVAIEKLAGNQLNLTTLSGQAQGATSHPSFTGSVIPDSSTTAGALQALETYVDGNLLVRTENDAVTDTAEMLDEMLVDDFCGASWKVCASLDSAPAQKFWLTIDGFHDGTASADAANAKDKVSGKMQFGANFTASVYVDIDGSGAAQKLRLMVAGDSGAPVSFSATRLDVKAA